MIDQRSIQSGFTLVELIVVIVVLAVLGGVAIPKFLDAGNKARSSSYLAHTNYLTASLIQYEMDTLATAPGGDFVINASNFQSSGLASRFIDNPFDAFGGSWVYLWYALGYSSLEGTGLPPFGAFPAAGDEFISKASGETPSSQSVPYDSINTPTVPATETSGCCGNLWILTYYPATSGHPFSTDETLTILHQWVH